MKEIHDLEDVRNTFDEVSTFQKVDGHVVHDSDSINHPEGCTCGHCSQDHSHHEGHVHAHSHGDGNHAHTHEHEHHHEHGEECCCGNDHGHEHSHEHHHEHEDECGCGHDHGHEHSHHVEGHPDDCQCELCHPHEEYCDVCGESLENCTCRMPDADKIKKVYILKNLGCANCAAKMEHKIKELPGVTYANVSFVTKQLRLSAANHEALLPQIQEICSSIESEVVVVPRDKKASANQDGARIYMVENLDCANCGAKIERAINEMPEVKECVLTFTTKKMRVSATNYDGLLEKMQAVVDRVEEGVVLKEKAGKINKQNSKIYLVKNLDCANCGAKIEAALNDLPEINECVLTFTTKKMKVSAASYDGLLAKMQAVVDRVEEGVVLEEMGSGVVLDPELDDRKKSGGVLSNLRENQALLEVVIGGLIFIITEWLGLVPEQYHIYCLVVAYIILGWNIVLTAVKNLMKGQIFDENFLMTVATLGAFGVEAWEEAVGVIFFYRVGEYFEQRAVEKSRGQIMTAVDMRPEVVNLLVGEDVKVIPAEEANVGDILLVRVGDRIPLDGVVVDGESLIDTSPVTGEPVPVKKKYGDEVVSGCVNTSGMLKIRVEKLLEESMVTKILDSVENAAASKPAIDKFITRFARIYTPIVVFLSIITAFVLPFVYQAFGNPDSYMTILLGGGHGGEHGTLYSALTFLVISCPCALVLSVPLAFFSGIGAGSKYGILFKGGVAMEALKNVQAVIMDKTGTVTKGNFVVQQVVTALGSDQDEVLRVCAGAEQVSTHPIAVSIVTNAKDKALSLVRPDKFEEIAGEGLVAYSGQDTILCGNLKLMKRYGVDTTGYAEASYGSEVLVARNGKYLGQILINDTLKDDAKEAISALKKMGLVTAMLTGDQQKEAQAVASEAGIDEVRAKLLPQDKLTELNNLRNKYGPVMFVGDGINDAPVLAGADAGAAMGSGADAAIEAADVVFMNSEVKCIPQAIAIARNTGEIAWQNVIFALAVKVVIMIAGMFGYASMWAAIFADTGVSLLCVLNSIRILYKKVQ
ncbi:MAG: heavy metal translocating P-type ATPase [Phascolarctobacterium sp.]|nr:heavy metal translocating P-type ATPase [Phascolarctobacterium sp.]